jgi:8-oxo-dGTP pyrophosphatase MutT (NUDIX family)
MASKGNLQSSDIPMPRLRACAICLRAKRIDSLAAPDETTAPARFEMLMVRLHDKESGRVFPTPPGGAIEPGESALAAALRETFEETGYVARLADSTGPGVDEPPTTNGFSVRYEFVWEGRTYDCTTVFFLCQLVDEVVEPEPVDDAYYNRGPTWVPVDEVATALDFMPIPRDAIVAILRPWLSQKR